MKYMTNVITRNVINLHFEKYTPKMAVFKSGILQQLILDEAYTELKWKHIFMRGQFITKRENSVVIAEQHKPFATAVFTRIKKKTATETITTGCQKISIIG